MGNKLRFAGRFFVLLFGFGFLALGVGIGIFGTNHANAEANLAEELTPLQAGNLERTPIGQTVLFEGLISARNPSLTRNFVAFIREEFQGYDDDNDENWRIDQQETPELLIEIDGELLIFAADYTIERPHERWQESDRLSYRFGEGTKRYFGMVARGTVMSIRTVITSTEGPVIQSGFLFGGSQSNYIDDRRETARWLPWIGGVFGFVGLFLAGLGIYHRGY